MRTSRAPTQRTPTTPEKISAITITVIQARVAIRCRADRNDCSVTPANALRLSDSCVNACTAWTDWRASDAFPDDAAIQSWFSRLSVRSRRPSTMIGTTITGTRSRTRPASFGDVTKSSTSPPIRTREFLSATETDEPMTDRIRVVSVVSRERTSPVMMRS